MHTDLGYQRYIYLLNLIILHVSNLSYWFDVVKFSRRACIARNYKKKHETNIEVWKSS